jgi:anti-anti-sigma factor
MTAISTRSFYVDQVQDVTVVCFIVSKINERNYELVSDELFELVEYVTSSGPIHVVLDMASIRQIDDWGLALLRAFHETIETNGGTIICCRLQPAVVSSMAEAGLSDFFHTQDTRGEAIRTFHQF